MAEESAEAVQWFRERLDRLAEVLEADEAEQALRAVIREARTQGLSQRGVVAELAQKGFLTRKDMVLSRIQVQRSMRQAGIAGWYRSYYR
jgi:hypothetical protein